MSRFQTFVLALTLTLCLVKAAASPIEGTWEGSRDGIKAATLTVTQKDDMLGGSLVLYIVHDNGDGSHNGQPLPPQPLSGVEWDGKTLRFSVTNPDSSTTPLDLKLQGDGKAELHVRGGTHSYETVPMLLRK